MDKQCPSFHKEMRKVKVMLQAELKIHTPHFLYHSLDIESLSLCSSAPLCWCTKVIGYLCISSAHIPLIFKASKCLLNLTDQSKIVQVDLLVHIYINP